MLWGGLHSCTLPTSCMYSVHGYNSPRRPNEIVQIFIFSKHMHIALQRSRTWPLLIGEVGQR